MHGLGGRLKKEREAQKLSQPELADLVGTSRRTVIAWEKGDSSPTGVQLSSLAERGFDVLYILTGIPAGQTLPLAPDESALLDNYRHLCDDQKQTLSKVSQALSISSALSEKAVK